MLVARTGLKRGSTLEHIERWVVLSELTVSEAWSVYYEFLITNYPELCREIRGRPSYNSRKGYVCLCAEDVMEHDKAHGIEPEYRSAMNFRARRPGGKSLAVAIEERNEHMENFYAFLYERGVQHAERYPFVVPQEEINQMKAGNDPKYVDSL